MSIEKRLRALENKLISDPVTLYLADGTTWELRGPKDLLLHLFLNASSGAAPTPGQAEQLDLIRRSVAAQEPGGGHMVELIQCALHAQAEE